MDWYISRKQIENLEDLRFRNSIHIVMEDAYFKDRIVPNLPTSMICSENIYVHFRR